MVNGELDLNSPSCPYAWGATADALTAGPGHVVLSVCEGSDRTLSTGPVPSACPARTRGERPALVGDGHGGATSGPYA